MSSNNVVLLPRIVHMVPNPEFGNAWLTVRHRYSQGHPPWPIHDLYAVSVPKDHKEGGVESEIFHAYENPMTKACADNVIATRLSDGTPAVLGLKRNNPPYKGTWYMAGGAMFGYDDPANFLATKCWKETGHALEPQVYLGTFFNHAEDWPASVLAICYATLVPIANIEQTKPADGHDQWRLFTEKSLKEIPVNETHWYPMLVWEHVLKTMFDFNIR